jgi:2-polyprenyl-6-methoxyphenol hydroxylase-like FAD-dependent oxidoreductase
MKVIVVGAGIGGLTTALFLHQRGIADGIHSAGRKHFYPDEGPPRWNGVMMWRGAVEWPMWLDGRTMAIGGGMGAKFVLYPIAHPSSGKQLTNWVVNIKVADGAKTPPPKESWSRAAHRTDYLPYARRFTVPGFDVEGLVTATPQAFEYPMCDRDPLPRWTFGRVTLLGDAAHPEVVRLNRVGGPERIIDEVEKRAPAGFDNVDEVLSRDERQAIVGGYAGKAGFSTPEKPRPRQGLKSNVRQNERPMN